MKKFGIVLLICCEWAAGQHTKKATYLDIQKPVFALTTVMMHDVVNPPAASRYYAYCMLGAYEFAQQHNPSLPGLKKLINQYPGFTTSVKAAQYDYKIAALYCILESGRMMLPSGYRLEENQTAFIKLLKKNKIPRHIIDSSVVAAKDMAAKIVIWSRSDNYFKLSTLLRYTPKKGDEYWYPTPPAYMEPVEPNWRIIRPMMIDSASQFKPFLFAKYSRDTTSEFYKMAMEVYHLCLNPVKENIDVANFWDCNPFAVATAGHMAIGFKKVSPGGHWMNITGIACKKAQSSIDSAIMIHTFVGVTLMDAFISCWDEKYRSNRVRPETFINRYVDIKWQPILQTPPFPEYASGHSVISAAAAEVLTYFLGDNFSYTDDSEMLFEIPARSFNSFRAASAEAALSRLYGGIHYRDAVEFGVKEGQDVGKFIVEKINNVK